MARRPYLEGMIARASPPPRTATHTATRRAASRAAVLCAALLCLAAQAGAQDVRPPQDPPPGALDRLEDRARGALDLFADELKGLMRGLGDGIDGLQDYGAPRMLPNGDILIPRNAPPAPPTVPAAPAAPDDPSIDL